MLAFLRRPDFLPRQLRVIAGRKAVTAITPKALKVPRAVWTARIIVLPDDRAKGGAVRSGCTCRRFPLVEKPMSYALPAKLGQQHRFPEIIKGVDSHSRGNERRFDYIPRSSNPSILRYDRHAQNVRPPST